MLSLAFAASIGWHRAHGHMSRAHPAHSLTLRTTLDVPFVSMLCSGVPLLPLGMSDVEFQRVAKRVPPIAECLQGAQARDGWPSLRALQARLAISDAELKAAVLRVPQLLLCEDYAVEVGPGLAVVQQRLALSDEQLKGLVLKLPQMLGLDFAAEVAPKLDALQQSLGCDDAALAAEVRVRILKHAPYISTVPRLRIHCRFELHVAHARAHDAPAQVLRKPSATGIEVRGAHTRRSPPPAMMCSSPPDETEAGKGQTPAPSKGGTDGADDDEEGGVPPFLFEGVLAAAAVYFTVSSDARVHSAARTDRHCCIFTVHIY